MSGLRYAVHAYAWTNSWSNETLDIIDRAKGLGFDLVEVPLMEIEKVDAAAIKARAESVGIGLCTSTACAEATDPTGEEASVRAAGLDYLKQCIKATADMGGTVFTGVTYSAIGRKITGRPDESYWDRAATVMKEAAQYAQDHGVTLERIDEPNVKVHLDAYHMNIEECDFYAPTKKAVPHLCHFHLSESHRGTPGTGVVDWEGIYRALGETNYQGIVGLESFESVSPAMAAATCMWRSLAESSDQLLGDGLSYLKSLEPKYYR